MGALSGTELLGISRVSWREFRKQRRNSRVDVMRDLGGGLALLGLAEPLPNEFLVSIPDLQDEQRALGIARAGVLEVLPRPVEKRRRVITGLVVFAQRPRVNKVVVHVDVRLFIRRHP